MCRWCRFLAPEAYLLGRAAGRRAACPCLASGLVTHAPYPWRGDWPYLPFERSIATRREGLSFTLLDTDSNRGADHGTDTRADGTADAPAYTRANNGTKGSKEDIALPRGGHSLFGFIVFGDT